MVWLARKVTVDGGVPLRTLPVWVTFTRTFSAVVGLGFAVSVNVASVPSVMVGGFAVMVTCGCGGPLGAASLSLTVTVAEDGEPIV